MEYKTDSTAVLSNETHFALAERSSLNAVRALHARIGSTPHITELIDGMPFVVLILNPQRQIVAANQKVCSLLGVNLEDALGRRPGELIGCIHSEEGPNGCGTGYHCKVCGAVNAILDCYDTGQKVTEECQIALHDGGALDWEVTTSRLNIEGHELICMGVQDISHQKRRSSLERTFFHDIINHLGAIAGFIQVIAEEHPESDEIKEIMILADELLEEVQSQRELTLAENGDLVLKTEVVELKPLLQRLGQLYQRHPVAKEQTIRVVVPENITVFTDAHLFRRVLGNMIKNALEASSSHDTVTVSCDCMDGYVSINVHNPGMIPADARLQIFKRSFTTKGGTGRGIGTYSMKLLGEKYLKGHVTFESGTEKGTIFTITLPQNNT